jgi:hypothetical protein
MAKIKCTRPPTLFAELKGLRERIEEIRREAARVRREIRRPAVSDLMRIELATDLRNQLCNGIDLLAEAADMLDPMPCHRVLDREVTAHGR